MGNGISEVALVLQQCDAGEIVQEIESLASQLSSGPEAIVEVVIKEAVNIFRHGSDLTSDVKVS